MNQIIDRFQTDRLKDTLEDNRWIVPVAGALLAALTVGLAVMWVAPMLRKQDLRELKAQGRGIQKRARSQAAATAGRVKRAVGDASEQGKQALENAAETLQEEADKVKKTARKKARQAGV